MGSRAKGVDDVDGLRAGLGSAGFGEERGPWALLEEKSRTVGNILGFSFHGC